MDRGISPPWACPSGFWGMVYVENEYSLFVIRVLRFNVYPLSVWEQFGKDSYSLDKSQYM